MMDEMSGYDRARALEMQARGATLDEIALTIGVSVSQLETIVRTANRSKIPKTIEEREAEVGKHLSMLERIVREMSQSWDKSKNDLVVTKVTNYDGRTDTGAEITIRHKVETITTPNIGDPSFIKELRATLADIRTIIALDAPKKVAMDFNESDEPRRIEIIEIVESP